MNSRCCSGLRGLHVLRGEKNMSVSAATPSAAHRLTHLPDTKTLHRGLEAKLWTMAGWWRRRGTFPAEAARQADAVMRMQPEFAGLSDKQLREAVRAEAANYRRPGAALDVTAGLALIAETA